MKDTPEFKMHPHFLTLNLKKEFKNEIKDVFPRV